ncbi:hypothetical protein QVA66_05455 [Staphylococcus chromogenes]|nr:hypothetical protein [Staphylococcus chromogenes]
MHSKILLGALMGLALAFATILGGWSGLALAILFGVTGGLVGAQLEGRIDARRFIDDLRFGGRG